MVSATLSPEKSGLLKQQIEFYFSNYNLAYDTYMQNELKTNNKTFKLANFLKFNKIKAFGEDITEQNLIEALENSSVITVNKEVATVSRIDQIPEEWTEWIKEADERSIYLKGFPLDTTLESIMEKLTKFVDKSKIEGVLMRRNLKKQFKGSIYATLTDKDSALQLLNSPIELVGKDDHLPEKKMKLEHQQEIKNKNANAKTKKLLSQVPRNCILKLINTTPNEAKLDIIKLKKALSFLHPIQYVDVIEEEDDEGSVKRKILCRFNGEDSASIVNNNWGKEQKVESSECLKILGELFGETVSDLSLISITEEEEIEYWIKAKESMKKSHQKKKSNKKNLRKPSAKKVKLES